MERTRTEKLFDIVSSLKKGMNVGIFPHVGVDGDCLGSTLALANALKKVNINAFVVSDGPIPSRFSFLPEIETIKIYSSDIKPKEFIFSLCGNKQFDFAILVDCADPDRVGNSGVVYKESIEKAVIDHHFTVGCPTKLCCVDATSSASGELVYDFIELMEDYFKTKLFSLESAVNIYTAVFSDTGGFKYTNTNSKSFMLSGNLFEKFKIDNRLISYNLFERTTQAKLKLEGLAFSATKFHENGRLAICLISRKMIEDCNAKDNDVDGVCADIKNVEGVDVSIVLREKGDGEIRGNVRSSNKFDASAFAVSMGGGGHVRAAGFSVEGITLQEGYDIVLKKSKLFLKK